MRLTTFVVLGAAILLAGCSDQLPTAPVSGKVLLDDQPLTFGGVMFQPEAGPPARGEIQPDGSFTLSTYDNGDGAILGKNQIRVTCFEGQNPELANDDDEGGLGTSLIPKKYNRYETSTLTFDVPVGGADNVVLELTN